MFVNESTLIKTAWADFLFKILTGTHCIEFAGAPVDYEDNILNSLVLWWWLVAVFGIAVVNAVCWAGFDCRAG